MTNFPLASLPGLLMGGDTVLITIIAIPIGWPSHWQSITEIKWRINLTALQKNKRITS